jgi:hypothetical protein
LYNRPQVAAVPSGLNPNTLIIIIIIIIIKHLSHAELFSTTSFR